jgi:hypothetical protein
VLTEALAGNVLHAQGNWGHILAPRLG